MARLVDMERTDEEKLDTIMPIPMNRPDYPPNLRIAFCEPELEKLGLDTDCEEGDMIDIRAFGLVKSVHKEDGCNRVEIQLTHISIENEMTETEEE